MELLVPAGNYETFKVAVHSGADAIYIGGKKFGARAFANNFSDEEMIKAIKYAHLYGVKVHVTVNTLINESELSNALEYLKFLYINGVDAVIIQDIGLISAAHNMFPDLEIHASTQMHNSNFNQIKFLESLGVKRVVFARELSIDEIDSIDTSLEKEIFIHGSLCVSYSGQCLFSSFILNRSGNKGECAGLCRLPYEIESSNKKIKTNGKYSLLELKPITGRTHQLRVHMKYLGHPIVGDVVYGEHDDADRLYLHAGELEITLPCGERKVFRVKRPITFDKLVKDSQERCGNKTN